MYIDPLGLEPIQILSLLGLGNVLHMQQLDISQRAPA
jgi:hypothetical protein